MAPPLIVSTFISQHQVININKTGNIRVTDKALSLYFFSREKKAVNITHPVFVFVAFVIEHAQRACILLCCHLWSVWLYNRF